MHPGIVKLYGSPGRAGGFHAWTNAEQIHAWWARNPNANVAMSTAGLLVVDVDGTENPWPSDSEKMADLFLGPVSLTAGGGRHHLFRQPAGQSWKNTASKIAPKVDTRANGGYVVLPPSVVGGNTYRWANELDAGPGALSEPPGWLVELQGGTAGLFPCVGCEQVAPQTTARSEDGNPIPEGQRNATMAQLAGVMRRVGMSRKEILVALVQINQDRCRPPLPDREVERVAVSIARYEPDQVAVAVAEDHWAQVMACDDPAERQERALVDPGPLPDRLLRIPGFISDVMDHCLATAPYPNLVLAFAGALALQATLAGRKVRDPGDSRTNLYLLGLALSAAGKDRPRKLNTEILNAVGLSEQVAGQFASGEGLQDALLSQPCMLFQTDEIDGMLQSINKSRDARHENIMSTLLTMFSSANSVFPMRRKAGRDFCGNIDQPCLVVFGTAIPNHYYEALSERMLTNGFFARTIILECGKRARGQRSKILPIPARVLETARWWADFKPGTGNLQDWHPEPRVVPYTEEGGRILDEVRYEAEDEYATSEKHSDTAGTTLWGRVAEHACKLALVYAISENHLEPRIGEDAARWAREFTLHQSRRMLYMAQVHVASNPFHAECLKLLGKLREAPGGKLSHTYLLKRMRVDAKTFQGIVGTLEQAGDIVISMKPTKGRSGRYYQLVEGMRTQGGMNGNQVQKRGGKEVE